MADTLSSTQSNLPPRSPFIGRREEVLHLSRLLADPDSRVEGYSWEESCLVMLDGLDAVLAWSSRRWWRGRRRREGKSSIGA